MSTKILIGVVVTIVIVAAIYFFMGPCKGGNGSTEVQEKVAVMDDVCKDKSPELHVVKVELVDGIWKVIYMKDGEPADLHVCPGDKISWIADKTDIYVQFYTKSLFGRFKKMGLSIQKLKVLAQTKAKADLDNFKMELQVLPEAESGKYYYSIFCTGEPAGYAEQDSPPVIIID